MTKKLASVSTLLEKRMEGFNWFIQHFVREEEGNIEYELLFFTNKERALKYFSEYKYSEDGHTSIQPLETVTIDSFQPSGAAKYFYYEYAL